MQRYTRLLLVFSSTLSFRSGPSTSKGLLTCPSVLDFRQNSSPAPLPVVEVIEDFMSCLFKQTYLPFVNLFSFPRSSCQAVHPYLTSQP